MISKNKIILTKIIYKGLRISFLPVFLRTFIQRNTVTILVFHNPSVLTFEKTLKYLLKHYEIISLNEYISSIENILIPIKKSVILTFDDGYKNNFQLVNIIRRYQVPVTIFVCAELIGTNRHFWGTMVPLGVTKRNLKKIPNKDRIDLFKKNGIDLHFEHGNDARQCLNYSEIEEMKSTGLFDFQSHTVSHPILINCTDAESNNEIKNSKLMLESTINNKIFALAFPNGDYSQREVKYANNAGYKCCLTTKPGYNNKNSNLFELKRIGITDNANLDEIIVRVSGLWGLVQTWYKTLHGLFFPK